MKNFYIIIMPSLLLLTSVFTDAENRDINFIFANPAKREIIVTIDPRIELMSTIQLLADYPLVFVLL